MAAIHWRMPGAGPWGLRAQWSVVVRPRAYYGRVHSTAHDLRLPVHTAPSSWQARYLKFCQDYNSKACCIPGHDLENQVQFENLIDGLGPGCKNPMMYPEVRYFYCLGCDPNQPEYTVTSTTPQQIRICKSFLDKLWRDPAFDECGVMYSNPCPTIFGDGFDPYSCGDDLMLPKQSLANAVAFANTFKPPGLDDFDFVEIDDSTDNTPCWKAPAFQSSAMRLRSSSSFATIAIMAFGLMLRSWL